MGRAKRMQVAYLRGGERMGVIKIDWDLENERPTEIEIDGEKYDLVQQERKSGGYLEEQIQYYVEENEADAIYRLESTSPFAKFPSEKLAHEICDNLKEEPPPTFGPDYLKKKAQKYWGIETYVFPVVGAIDHDIAAYLDGRYKHYQDCFPVDSDRQVGWLDGHLDAIMEIRTAVCGEKKE